jgi:sterol desaturase/sphingolipid hydroxylase (fatty acid hydroxylase superfamily)
MTFTPRLKRRPKYPPFASVLISTAVRYLRVSVLCALVTFALKPSYDHLVHALLASGHSERAIFTGLTLCCHTLLYCCMNGFFFYCDRKDLLVEYKFPRKSYQVPDWNLLRRTWTEAFVNQVATGPVALYYMYLVFKYFGMPSLTAPLPSFRKSCEGYALAVFINDVGFYWSHRLVHAKPLYARIHKQHHTYTGTIGFAAEYASPPEQIVSNQLPTVGGCLFFGAHPLVFLIWLACRLQQTYEAHSGYCFYGSWLHKIGLTNSDAAAYHDYHHSGNRGNFGAVWLDWLCGTMDAWLQLGGTEGYIKMCKSYRVGNSRTATKQKTTANAGKKLAGKKKRNKSRSRRKKPVGTK